MSSLADLWDENKYSEGDPIRQLIAASKAYKDWPMDTLTWGADLVDMGTGALSKLANGERRNQIKTDLSGNLRRAFSEPRKELGFSAGPAPDTEAGRSFGRMLNPALLVSGNINLSSKVPSNFALRKQMKEAVDELPSLSRRDFMKKSAGIAGGTAAATIPGAKLLKKFAPEERAVVKQAAVEAAPKYKYNSLKEYLDDVAGQASRHADEFPEEVIKSPKELLRERLLKDEEAYNTSKFFYKDNLKGSSPGEWIDPFTGQPHSEEFLKNIRNTTDDFSPQAKQEMKEFKSWADVAYDGDWALGATKEFPR